MASTSTTTSPSGTNLPPNFASATGPATGKTYYINKKEGTTSFRHPRHTELHEPYTPGVPYPHGRIIDDKGRAYYLDREAKTSSWLHPGKLAELKSKGVLDREGPKASWRDYILEEISEVPGKDPYWVDYKTGEVSWQSPDDVKEAREKAEARREAARGANA
jgi:hypothetical protein